MSATGKRRPTNRRKEQGKTHYRAIWISDVHLGTPGCKAEHLVDFLKHHTCDRLYLVGDIIDGWKLRSGWYWPQEHTNVVRKVLTKAKRQTKVFYVTGNHDEFLRKFVDYKLEIGNIRLVNEAVHETADGRRLLVIHGDLFDVITRYHRWIAMAGDALYEGTMRFNFWFNRARAMLGMRYWSLSAFAKQHVKTAVNIVSTFEDSLARECRRRGFDGVVCGHIHHADARDIGGVTYYNCGDWVESCTALTEDMNGRIQVVRWVQLDHLNQASQKVTPLSGARKAA
ncbi:MAG: UDP-2,3-diacylglucosamine diphosphatase [Sinimarinibacterium flocculans]|uniref:UDP-2,3-diacylglucosamine pyrophosphatase LpxH n=1 Tax=Sinimarinibacterium flocculans TaxID=985250 RepID=A0A318EJS4_9GAMM|nr:UDP-2,3-diacylglucosamine diphosphatase [Sinimarinibacterium flocculans]MEC9363481.1 UDP-2,3-diacylglucosamine diphosphatase [Pseudomonadota bacterium]PXV69510.1 UDP-2,3-diacylglucosamine pyrophosphatase LpxH [Sinimarinibacterium flocculans]